MPNAGDDIFCAVRVRLLDNRANVFFRVFDERQNRHHCDAGEYAIVRKCFHRFESLRDVRRAGFDFFAERIICCCNRECDSGVDLADLLECLGVAENQIAFGDDVNGKVIFGDDAECLSGEIARGFNRLIRIVHRPSTDRADGTFARQLIAEQINRIDLDEDVGKVFDLITLAPRIAIDALMLASAIQVHRVLDAKPRIGLLGRREECLGGDVFNHSSYPTGMIIA